MKKILTWRERCCLHPAHISGMITSRMIEQRMQEEIDELREFYDVVDRAKGILNFCKSDLSKDI